MADTNLAAGHAYTLSPAPNGYPDSGRELTNGALAPVWPLDAWVGWNFPNLYAVDIVFDMGRDIAISTARLHTRSHTDWGIHYPYLVAVSVLRDGSRNWQPLGPPFGSPPQTAGFSTAWIGTSVPGVGRYIWFRATAAGGTHFFIDEVEVWGAVKFYDLSVGKFYTFSRPPVPSYPDAHPLAPYTDGTKLTDEVNGVAWPLTDWVGWWDAAAGSVDVTVDLGRPRQLDQASIHCRSHTNWGIFYPTVVDYRTSPDATAWTFHGSVSPPADTAAYSVAWLTRQLSGISARFVRYTLRFAAGRHLHVDELQVVGALVQSWKGVDAAGCYAGAYSTDATWTMDVPRHEAQTGKTIAMALWYQDMNPSAGPPGTAAFSALEVLWTGAKGLGANGYSERGHYRFLQVGWHPADLIAADLARGALDAHQRQWLLDAMSHLNAREGDLIWVRPMAEMNASWTFPGPETPLDFRLNYGGDPLNYRRAWRRLYNIAERVGATDRLIFVFSPNARSFPGEPWNAAEQYYPGDQYVDWYGLSVYDEATPVQLIQGTAPLPGVFPHQARFGHKPMMISEGGVAFDTGTAAHRQAWIQGWFAIKQQVAEIKAFVWFNPAVDYGQLPRYRFEKLSPNEQAIFRANVQDGYWLK